MKQMSKWLAAVAALSLGSSAWAALIDFTGSGGTYSAAGSYTPGANPIPDYPGSGLAYTLHFGDLSATAITGLTVTFTTSGGWNGDIYAYLSHGDGLAVLLNRVGAGAGDADGYGTSGFDTITLGLAGADDIHGVMNPTSAHGAYEADGRLSYTDTARINKLDVFDGANPYGNWTLYFEDDANLNISSLDSWSVNLLAAVPEPTTWALVTFGVLFGAVQLRRFLRARAA